MKGILSLLSGIMMCLIACKNSDQDVIRTAATIQVINAVVDVPVVKVNPSGGRYSFKKTTDSVKYSANKFYFSPTGGSSIRAVASPDSTKVLFSRSVNLKSAVYTLYLAGTAASPDTLFREEVNFPFISMNKMFTAADSIVNVRFVNLSPNSTPIKVRIANAATDEIANLPYKTIGSWKAYPAKLTSTPYSFQVRSVADDALLATFNLTANAANRFKNVTLVIKGLQGTTTGVNAFGVFMVNYY